MILSIVANDDMEMIQLDVKTAFLYGNLNEEIFMIQPRGFEKGEDMVCRLTKSIYGLKQASREWNKCFISFLKLFDLKPISKDNCVLIRKNQHGVAVLIIAIYVDDGLVCSNDKSLLKEVVDHLQSKFDISVMSPDCFVGLQILRNREKRSMIVHQNYYTLNNIKRFEMENSKPLSTPMESNLQLSKHGCSIDDRSVEVPYKQAIGSLIYLSKGTRPDISYAVNKLASYADSVKSSHWSGVKRIFRYLKSSSDLGLYYKANDNSIISFSDSDFAGDIDTKKSTSGILLLVNGAPVGWRSSKQTTVATSTTNAEFISASLATSEIICARQFLSELCKVNIEPTVLYIDNQSAIKLIVNNQVHTKIKHIDVKYMFVREAIENKEVRVSYIETSKQVADILTKPLGTRQFEILRETIGLKTMNIMKYALMILMTIALASSTGTASEVQELTLYYKNPCDVLKTTTEKPFKHVEMQRSSGIGS